MRGFAALPKGILNEANRGEERNCFIVIKTTCKQPNSGANDYYRMELWIRRQKKETTFDYTEKATRLKWNTITGYPGLVGTFESSQQLLLKTVHKYTPCQ